MKYLRILFAIPFMLVLSVLIFSASFTSALSIQLRDSTYIPNALRTSGIYEEIPQIGWDLYQNELEKSEINNYESTYYEKNSENTYDITVDGIKYESSSIEITDKANSNSDEQLENPLEDITYEEVEELYTDLDMAEYLDSELTKANNSMYRWLDGEDSSLYISIDLRSKVDGVIQWAFTKTLDANVDNSLAVCTKADLESIFTSDDLENLNMEDLPCRFDLTKMDEESIDYLLGTVLKLNDEQISSNKTDIQDIQNPTSGIDYSEFNFELTEDDLDLTPMEIERLKLNYQSAKYLPIILALSILVLAIIVFALIPGKAGKFYTTGSVIILPAMAAISWGFAGGDIIKQILLQSQLDPSLGMQEELVFRMMEVFITPVLSVVGYFGIGYLILGITLIAGGILTERHLKAKLSEVNTGEDSKVQKNVV